MGVPGVHRAILANDADLRSARGAAGGPIPIALAILASWCLSAPPAAAGEKIPVGGEGVERAGVPPMRALGTDGRGIPIACGTGAPSGFEVRAAGSGGAAGLPPGTRGWECIPGAIFADGAGSFRVEVDTNGPVSRVTLQVGSLHLEPALGTVIELRDDGQGEDRKARDFVYTGGPFSYNTSMAFPDRIDPQSAEGIHVVDVGPVDITEEDGTATQFLISPSVGLVRPGLPPVSGAQLSESVLVTSHLINVRTETRATQKNLRFLPGDFPDMTCPIYSALPDDLDFLVLFSTSKIELLPMISTPNFYAGVHYSVRTAFTGTGLPAFDGSAFYCSGGRLQGINILDAYDRGISSQNATHEIIHQWCSYTDQSLGLSDGTGHYNPRSSVGSLVGGVAWIENLDGTFTVNCDEGRSGAHSAPPLDRYMMGLIDGSAVGPLRIYSDASPGPYLRCGGAIDDIVRTVTIGEIQSVHGVRSPGPAGAQRDFSIGFVAETQGRFLDPVELLFYETLAAHYTKPVPPEEPVPYVANSSWVPVTRFFGEGVTLRSEVPLPSFIRGDANGDGSVDLSDAVFILFALFAQSQDPRCPDAMDSNDDGAADLSDVVRLLETLFLDGPPLPPPYPGPGMDPTLDLLACPR